MSKKPLLIDTDPGIDDAIALAIILHSEEYDVRLVTSTAGNVGIEKTTNNILKLMKFWNLEIPVAKGCARPLVRPEIDASGVHGDSGMDGYTFEEPDDHLLMDVPAAVAIHQTIQASKTPVTMMAIGPLTNIALWLRLYPEDKHKVEEFVIMGGSMGRGNSGVLAEYNCHYDPEAAKILFDSGMKVVMMGLDVGLQALVYPEDSIKIKTFGKTGEMIYGLLQRYRGKGLKAGLKMYDACASAYLLKPDLFTYVNAYVDVETSGSMTSGATLVDLRGYLGPHEPNTKVADGLNQEEFIKWFMDALPKH